MKYEIIVDDNLNDTLTRIATEQKMTASQYAANIVNSWLGGQFRGAIIKKINEQTIAEVKEIKEVIDNQLKPK